MLLFALHFALQCRHISFSVSPSPSREIAAPLCSHFFSLQDYEVLEYSYNGYVLARENMKSSGPLIPSLSTAAMLPQTLTFQDKPCNPLCFPSKSPTDFLCELSLPCKGYMAPTYRDTKRAGEM